MSPCEKSKAKDEIRRVIRSRIMPKLDNQRFFTLFHRALQSWKTSKLLPIFETETTDLARCLKEKISKWFQRIAMFFWEISTSEGLLRRSLAKIFFPKISLANKIGRFEPVRCNLLEARLYLVTTEIYKPNCIGHFTASCCFDFHLPDLGGSAREIID